MNKEKYTIETKKTVLSVVQTEIDSIKTENTVKTGIRIYDGKHMGIAGAIGSYDEARLEKAAVDNLKSEIPYGWEPSSDCVEAHEEVREIIPDDEFIGEMEEMLSELKKSQPAFGFSNKVLMTEESIRLENDLGLKLAGKNRTLEVGLLFKEKTSANIMDGFVGFSGVKYDRKRLMAQMNEVCDAYLKPVELESEGKLPVIFSTNDSLPFQKLLSDLNGLNYGTGGSLLSGKLNEKLFSDEFSLYQNLDPALRETNIFFDAEGVVNKGYRYDFIKDGVFVSPYSDKKTASKYGLDRTGSSACAYDSVPRISALGIDVQRGGKTIKEMLGGQKAVLVYIASGGDFTPRGGFGSPVQLAFYFDGEKLLGRLPQIQVKSNMFDMFGKDFRGISSDRIFDLEESHYMLMDLDVKKI